MAMKVGISFKEDEEELFNFLKKQLSASIYIKQLIKEQMEKEEKPKQVIRSNRNNFDF